MPKRKNLEQILSKYGDNYRQQVLDLKEWFKKRLQGETVTLTTEEYASGTDSLPEPFKRMVQVAFDEWLTERKYELSYNQMCLAFFHAAQEVGALDTDSWCTPVTQ